MKKGMIIGKFMPLHSGHVALINFACDQIDCLFLILCVSDKEPISGNLRKKWIEKTFSNPKIITELFFYKEDELPNTSVSSREASKIWADALQKKYHGIDFIFSSEEYGDFLAEYMHAIHIPFDKEKMQYQVAASLIRENPFMYWEFIADAAKPYFVKKIILVGTESTGKSLLTERLAKCFNTSFVPEMARDILEHTESCEPHHLQEIAFLHAAAILKNVQKANRILFCDTDVNITKSYSLFLFKEELETEKWIDEVNNSDLYFFLEPDCPFVQDGTRLSKEQRDKLSEHHRKFFTGKGVKLISVNGTWDERFEKMKDFITKNVLAA